MSTAPHGTSWWNRTTSGREANAGRKCIGAGKTTGMSSMKVLHEDGSDVSQMRGHASAQSQAPHGPWLRWRRSHGPMSNRLGFSSLRNWRPMT